MAGTTWKSPLSILMGAARNDDDDLELNDYFHPTRSTPAIHTPGSKSGNNGVSSYLPFRNFGLKSPAPTPAKDNIMNGSTNNTSFNGSPVPPLSSFPPQIQSTDDEIIEHIGDIATDIEDRQNSDDHQYSGVSHPFFHQLDLTAEDRGDDKSNNNDQYNDINNNIDEQAMEKKAYITWSDQKAIGTTFNFTNSIIGAGAMGLGGAFAASGGGISVIMLCTFAYLMKLSLDLLIDLCNCPLIIQLARKNEAEHNRCDDIDDIESDFDDDDEDDDNVSFANSGEPVFEQLNMDRQDKSEAQHVATDSSKEEENHQSNSDSPDDKNKKGDSSPLMARQEEDENDVNALQTLTATTSLKDNIHPLAASPERRNREELLTMDVTEPRYFSPLIHLDPDTNPKVNAEKKSIPKQYQHTTISPCTYEELGRAAYGANGRLAVLLSKSLYAFGCLVAYVVVVRDNFGPALRRITIGETQDGSGWLYDDNFLAFWVSAIFMLPLSCPRTMKSLAKFSFVSILSIIFLVLVVIYLYFTCINPEGSTQKLSFYENWIEIRSLTGLVQSLGCFVFTFVCHHTVNLAYESLPTPIRNTKVWRRVSTNSIALALQTSLAIGIFAYLTFGAQTPADVLMGYPSSLTLANVARLLLCLTMVLTFPLPFLTCREMSILAFVDMYSFYHQHNLKRYNICSPMWETTVAVLTSIWAHCTDNNKQKQETTVRIDDTGNLQMQRPSFWKRVGLITENANEDNCRDLAQALLGGDDEYGAIRNIGGDRGKEINPSPLSSRSGSFGSSETTVSSIVVPTPSWLLTDRQLTFAWHAVLTFSLWTIVTICAILSPSLGDVLDVVGAGTGTLLSFVLPALFSFKLRGYSNLALSILVIGGITGLLGTVFSCIKFMKDAL